MTASPDSPHGQPLDQGVRLQILDRLLGTETHDKFAERAHRVVDLLSERLAPRSAELPNVPARLGSFLVGPALGRGGMGTVFRGVHEKTGKVVAIKTAPSGSDVARFLRSEALALGGLDHRGVVQVFDHGEQDGFVWMAMQMVRGRTLHDVIHERWKQPSEPRRSNGRSAGLQQGEMRQYLGWFRDLAQALGAIHARGVVHRDIKPANVMIGTDGVPCIIDFGLSLDMPEHAVVDTLAGTVPYMSPEQVLALTELDGRSDVYSLAACLFELLSGRRLVGDDTQRIGLLRQVAFSAAPRLSSVAPWTERALDGVLERALAKNPQDRYRKAEDFATDLECVLTGKEPRHARTRWTARAWRHRRAIVVVVLLLAAGAWFGSKWWRRHADLNALSAQMTSAIALRDKGTDAAASALSRALELMPAYGNDLEFQRIYRDGLAEFAPRITKRLFQRAALVQSSLAGRTPAGLIGEMAERYLATVPGLSEAIRTELVVQAMFPCLQGGLYDRVIELRAMVPESRDSRVLQLAAAASVLSRAARKGDPQALRKADPQALAFVLDSSFDNRGVDVLCCRAYLLLELFGKELGPTVEDLGHLSEALSTGMKEASQDGTEVNLLTSMQALTLLRLGRFSEAELKLIDRLTDKDKGPSDEERPAMRMLACAAACLRIADIGDTAHSMNTVVSWFLEAAAADPALVKLFAREFEAASQSTRLQEGAFDRTVAEFFEELMSQKRTSAEVFRESTLTLIPYAEQDWGRRNEWHALLGIAELLAQPPVRARLDAETGDEMHRRFWLLAILVAGWTESNDSEASKGTRLNQAGLFRDAAVSSLSAPHAEFDTALACVRKQAHPDDPDECTRIRQCIASMRTRIAAADKDTSQDLLKAWRDVLSAAEDADTPSRESER